MPVLQSWDGLSLYMGERISMITAKEIREWRELRGLSLRDVAKFCEISPQLIGQVETGKKYITDYNYWQIVNGINKAFAAKQNQES